MESTKRSANLIDCPAPVRSPIVPHGLPGVLEFGTLNSGELLGNVEIENGLVYDLYGWTKKEIGIVEGTA